MSQLFQRGLIHKLYQIFYSKYRSFHVYKIERYNDIEYRWPMTMSPGLVIIYEIR